ncbi:hypothetical protein AWC38_SpisGene19047 [Stylophora pistillata]|uniref:Uncharacterized protein n=1 Tax=Stylophora pistillata TaxID=50429 RepID=A0A2B4RHL9_STYPI|nr:hypothetical protein AWC38_SpisGene19047 [Stylophora pistillata]
MRTVYLLVLTGFLAITGLAFLIAGIVLLSKGDASCPGRISPNKAERCSYSEEAITKGLDKFLQKVQDSYYRLHPNKISTKPNVSPAEIRAKYRSYDPSPRNIKIITDEALALLVEINAKTFQSHKLKPRERKALAQVKHYLQHIFGTPYDVNYYAGVLEEEFVKRLLQPEFLEVLMKNYDEISVWEKKNGKSVNQSLRESLVESVGKPIEDFFTYLRRDHMQYCVSSNVSSGLATLPLPYVYVNNIADKSRPTNRSLPTGERLNGKDSYKLIVSYFTTNTMSPKEINDLGFKMLNELYPQVGSVTL